MTINQKAKAKINLHLEVGNKSLNDNKHDLYATYNFAQFADFLAIDIDKTGDNDRTEMKVSLSPKLSLHLDLQGRSKKSFINSISDEDSLVKKSVDEFFNTYKIDRSEYSIKIELLKCIPDMAGLAGGSSDAAATLRSLVIHFDVDDSSISELCNRLGSDVYPCYLSYLNKTILECRTSGNTKIEQLPIQATTKYVILLIKPPTSINTTDAFYALNRPTDGESAFKLKKEALQAELINVLCTPYANQKPVRLSNDFLQINFELVPELEEVLSLCKKLGAVHASVTGSGSCAFALFPKVDYAQKCYFEIDKKFDKTWWQTITFFK